MYSLNPLLQVAEVFCSCSHHLTPSPDSDQLQFSLSILHPWIYTCSKENLGISDLDPLVQTALWRVYLVSPVRKLNFDMPKLGLFNGCVYTHVHTVYDHTRWPSVWVWVPVLGGLTPGTRLGVHCTGLIVNPTIPFDQMCPPRPPSCLSWYSVARAHMLIARTLHDFWLATS